MLDGDAAYQALTARDARFDGRLFVGVTSTRIYCRPICRVRTPMRKNCRFFATPAQAEAAAFRPCLKCRPEIAPGADFAWTVDPGRCDADEEPAVEAGVAGRQRLIGGVPVEHQGLDAWQLGARVRGRCRGVHGDHYGRRSGKDSPFSDMCARGGEKGDSRRLSRSAR